MGARHGIIDSHFRELASLEQRGGCPTATCPNCRRECRVYWPTGGDGTVRITFWHKGTEREWCRAYVDVADVNWTEWKASRQSDLEG